MDGGDITFNATIDDKEVFKELANVKRKLASEMEKRDNNVAARNNLMEQSAIKGAYLDQQKAILSGLTEKTQKYREQAQYVKELQSEYDAIERSVEEYNSKIAESNRKIEKQKALVEDLASRAQELSDTAPESSSKTPFDGWKEELGKVEKRISGLIKRVFFFSLITRVLRSALSYFGGLLSTSKEFTAEVARLKAALATAFQPLVEVAIPALTKLVQLATMVAMAFANIISWMFGTTASKSASSAKALNKEADAIGAVGGAADSAKKKLAGFDEINNIGDDPSGGGGGGGAGSGMDFEGLDFEKYKMKLLEFQAWLSLAALALGVILLLTGANIPLGLAMIVFGAVGLYKTVTEDWEAIPTEVAKRITQIMTVVGLGLLAIGAILCFSGVNIPLGIGMMAVGGLSLAAAVALNWNAILMKVKSVWTGIKQYWNSNIAHVFTLDFWSEKFSCIGDALMEKVTAAANWAVEKLNWLINFFGGSFSLGSFGGGGSGSGSYGGSRIPGLARGAVIPPNAPFVAMLGDQRHGTNIEAPLSTIQEAVAAVVNSDMMYQAFFHALVDAGAGAVNMDGNKVYDIVRGWEHRNDVAFGR